MLTQDNLVLNRTHPNGSGGLEFLYRIKEYGISAVSLPREELSQICWEVDVVKYKNNGTLEYENCYSTKLANKTLIFHNDKALDEFLAKAFEYFNELSLLEGMLKE